MRQADLDRVDHHMRTCVVQTRRECDVAVEADRLKLGWADEP